MPLPFILGGLAVAAVATGAKKGYDGYQDKKYADSVLDTAKTIYEKAQKSLDVAQQECGKSLNELGELYLAIGQDFNEFKTLADKLIGQLEQKRNIHLEAPLPQLALAKIESIGFNSSLFVSKMATGAVGGVAAAYAVYGGVMTLATASTGTAISALSGAAATNAALAAIGGGSIASGGFGMAVGAQILGGVVAAPVALVAGFAYASYAEKAVRKAWDSRDEAQKFEENAKLVQARLATTTFYIDNIIRQVTGLRGEFQHYLHDLKAVEIMVNSHQVGEFQVKREILPVIENGYALAAILADIITTPLFKVKTDGRGNPVLDSNNQPTLLNDELGLNVPNSDEMSQELSRAMQYI